MKPPVLLKAVVATALALPCLPPAEAAPQPASLFQSGMVLQQETKANVWGAANPGEKITVRFRGATVEGVAGADGKWRVAIPSGAAGGPFDLSITGDGEVTLGDVWVGEVWLASGQSNMAFALLRSEGGPQTVAQAEDPALRFFEVEQVATSSPQENVSGKWVGLTPVSAGRFSAVAYHFARRLREELKVPVGILSSSWGGTGVTSWISREAFEPLGASEPFYARWRTAIERNPGRVEKYEADLESWQQEKAAAKAAGRAFTKRPPIIPPGAKGFRNEPHVLFNGMIHPLIPYSIRGTIWYQGEGNTPFAGEYEETFCALIADWRQRFGQGAFPFFFVQLASFIADDRHDWPALREAQAHALKVPNTGMAVAFDLGERDDIHPKKKREVGERLAALALNRTYARLCPDEGPRVRAIRREGAALRVEFDPVFGELELRQEASGFEIAGADRQFQPARAFLRNGVVMVESEGVPAPVFVRYLWKNYDTASVYNTAGFPAPPFCGNDPEARR